MNNTPYVSWGAILGGAAIACALSVVMLQFGSAIGFSMADMDDVTVLTPGRVFGGAFFILWIQVLSSMIGGYLAGRLTAPADLKPMEAEVRDGAHGLLVWAASTLAVFAGGAIVAAFYALAPAEAEPVVRKTPQMIANEEATAIIIAFSMAATSLVSAVASWWAATKGGDHRDGELDVRWYFSFKQR